MQLFLGATVVVVSKLESEGTGDVYVSVRSPPLSSLLCIAIVVMKINLQRKKSADKSVCFEKHR